MLDLDAVIARLEAQVPDLANRVEGAAGWTRLMKSGHAPAGGLAAYVLPLGLQGMPADAMAGSFTQMIRDVTAVTLIAQSSDAAGERALKRIKPLLEEVLVGLAGWSPGETVGVFELVRGTLVNAGNGLLAYQLEFAINDQLEVLA